MIRISSALVVAALLATATAEAGSGRDAEIILRVRQWVLLTGKDGTMLEVFANAFGLSPPVPIKKRAWQDERGTRHFFHVAAQVPDSFIAYEPPGGAYSVTWHLDAEGRVVETALGEGGIVKLVPRDRFADRFAAEINYWNCAGRTDRPEVCPEK